MNRNGNWGSSLMVKVPGKVFILGEYAVTSGSAALVAAVDCYAMGWWDGGNEGESGGAEVSGLGEDWDFSPGGAAQEMLLRLAGKTEGGRSSVVKLLGAPCAPMAGSRMCIDTVALGGGLVCGGGGVENEGNRMRQVGGGLRCGLGGTRKPGLGSSAAACVVAAGLVGLACGRNIQDSTFRTLAGDVAREAHRRFQGGLGSGADVDASLFGGMRVFKGPGQGFSLDSVGSRIGEAIPHGIDQAPDSREGEIGPSAGSAAHKPAHRRNIYRHFRFYGHGLNSDQTMELNSAEAVSRWKQLPSWERSALLREMSDLVDEGSLSLAGGDMGSFISVVDSYGMILQRLGTLLHMGVVTSEHLIISGLAREYGGAAKSCGAGGGMAVLVLPDPDDEMWLNSLDREIGDKTGMVPLEFSITPRGMITATRA